MTISIVIPNYNGLHYLKPCIYSLDKLNMKPTEIIVVDNNSNDGSLEWLNQEFPQIKQIPLDKNYGFSKAVNEGINSSKSEFVVLLNNDIEVDAHWLENLVKPMQDNPKLFSCSSKMIQFHNRELIDDAGDQYTLLGWAYKRGDGKPIDAYISDSFVFSSCAGAAIYRKSILDIIGLFDEHFFAYLEDVDLGFRALACGYKNYFCSNAIVYHIGSGTSGSKYNDFKVELAAKNNLLVIKKNMPLVMIVLNSPLLILGFLIKYIFFHNKGFAKVYRTGLSNGFKDLKYYPIKPFSFNSIKTYFTIEWLMIKSTFEYLLSKIILIK